MYGSSMYGGGMGGMYGRSMYGGGYGSSMYGGGMGGGMYGQGRQGEAEFFAPKCAVQAGQDEQMPGRISELKELNTSFLDSLHGYGDRLYSFGRRLVMGLKSLHTAVRTGKLSHATARRLAAFAVAATIICIAGAAAAARATMLRRRRRALDRLFGHLAPGLVPPLRAHAAAPLPWPAQAALTFGPPMPRAAPMPRL